MNILGIDTCFPALTVAVGRDLGKRDPRTVWRTEAMASGHAERLWPLVGELLDEANLSVEDLDRIAVTIGPGSFTGTRIGIAAARALKLARDLPIVTFSSLEAIAVSPRIEPASGEDLIVAIDARRGEAYAQVFDGRTRAPLGEPQMVAMTDLTKLSCGRPILAVGTASEALAGAVIAAGGAARAEPGMIFPDMTAAVVMAAGRAPAASAIEPLYLRPPDAKPQDGKSLERVGT